MNHWRSIRHVAALLILLAIPVGVFLYFESDIEALLWHAGHGNRTFLGGHTVSVPAMWWNEIPDSVSGGVISRVRSREDPLGARVRTIPFDGSEYFASDEQMREAQQRVAAFANSGRGHMAGNPAPITYAAITVQTGKFPLFCMRSVMAISKGRSTVRLQCNSSREPWTYIYDGPAQSEKEAIGILASLR